jgi:hypothetical protein
MPPSSGRLKWFKHLNHSGVQTLVTLHVTPTHPICEASKQEPHYKIQLPLAEYKPTPLLTFYSRDWTHVLKLSYITDKILPSYNSAST